MKTYLSYYKKALVLLKEHSYILFFALLLSEASAIVTHLVTSQQSTHPVLRVIDFLLSLLVASYFFIPTVLFEDAINHKRSSHKRVLKLMAGNFLRTLKPVFLGMIFFAFCIMVVYFVSRPTNNLSLLTLLMVLISIVTPLSSYFGIYYMLEKKSVFSSLWKSIGFTLQHPVFSFLPAPFFLIANLLSSQVIIDPQKNIYLYLMFIAVMQVVSLIVICAYLLYYRYVTKHMVKLHYG